MSRTGELAAISKPRNKPPTPAERLAKLDPDLARFCDQWQADDAARLSSLEHDLDFAYGLALYDKPAPPILDEEERLAFELGQFALTADPLLEVADGLRAARDEAYVTLGRVEQEIAKRYVDALRVIPQAALPSPPRDDDPTEDFHKLRGDRDLWDEGEAHRRWLVDHLQAPPDQDGHGWVDANDERMEDLVKAHEAEHHGDQSRTHKLAHSTGEWHQRTIGHVIDPEPTELGPDGLPIGTPPWDDPDGASTVETVEMERTRASSGRGPRWWARIVSVCFPAAALGTAALVGVWTLLQQASP